MASKTATARTPRKAAKAPLTSKTLRRVSASATKSASRSAFEHVDELLVVKEGWLVKVDKTGKVTKRVKQIKLPAAWSTMARSLHLRVFARRAHIASERHPQCWSYREETRL